jgi:hypothetical protein
MEGKVPHGSGEKWGYVQITVIILTEKTQVGKSAGGDSGFKFETNWLKEERCRSVVEEDWGCKKGVGSI